MALTSTLRLRKKSLSISPPKSDPTTEIITGLASKAAKLTATLPAPPATKNSFFTSTTGTGASGEMRLTDPLIKWSNIISPTTIIFLSLNDFKIVFKRVVFGCISFSTKG